ncbi:alpha/beta fold hydrolase [Nocardia sp. NPDC051321]|uniref:alpha/beta fold hydrolase n=1 Tax=Nocardia sp. NPDC051321 TaxID=3364323 RepID=UPI0037A93CAF
MTLLSTPPIEYSMDVLLKDGGVNTARTRLLRRRSMDTRTVVSATGRRFTVDSFGSGSGFVVVHGSGVTAMNYRRFARRLADGISVHLYDRGGRDGAPGVGLDGDIADLTAVLTATGARKVFGHSYGGFVALEAARALSLDGLAVYDPACAAGGLFPTDFIEPMAEALVAHDTALAMTLLSRGQGAAGALSRLPIAAQKVLARIFFRTPIGRQFEQLLPSVLAEARAAVANTDAARYTAITAPTILAAGAASPPYFRAICDAIAVAIPGSARADIPRATHNAPIAAARALTSQVDRWFRSD